LGHELSFIGQNDRLGMDVQMLPHSKDLNMKKPASTFISMKVLGRLLDAYQTISVVA
jgi:hypothetical protein